MKYKRQNQISKIIRNMPVHTHDELIDILKKEGYNVTQATVSRDIKELGLIKVPASDGSSVYSVPESASDTRTAHVDMIADSIKNISVALHTVVINTYPGMAAAVAASIDSMMRNDFLGSVAGDDTVLIVTKSEPCALELADKIKTVFKAV